MSSNFKSAGGAHNGSELCQVISTSYVKYFVPSYVKYLQKHAHGSEGTVTCERIVLRACIHVCYARGVTKPPTQPILHWESRVLVYIECWRTKV